MAERATQDPLTVIIPTLNEVEQLRLSIASARDAAVKEIVVVDGGSEDGTCDLARELGVTLLKAPKGRATQMNVGAHHATSPILLFLHADTILPDGFAVEVLRILDHSGHVAGAFQIQISGVSKALRWIERGINWRSRLLKLPYGDQGLFLRRRTFFELQGFPEIPIMEDFAFLQRLKQVGKLAIAHTKVKTSGRRWQTTGAWRMTLINQTAILAYLLGQNPSRIAHWYRKWTSRG